MTINLHELINKPWYGSAAKIIGPPDEHSGNGGQRKYIVNVHGTTTVDISEAIIVTATSEKEAKTKAYRATDIDHPDGAEILGVLPE